MKESMKLFLDEHELETLTGYKSRRAQSRWLRSQGYYVECNARGIPRITYKQVHAKRSPAEQNQAVTPMTTEPNLAALRQRLRPSL